MSILKLKCADSENNRIKFFSKHIIISHFTDIMNASTCYSSSIVYLIILHSLFILLNSSRPIATTSISDQKHSLQVRIYEYCNTIWSRSRWQVQIKPQCWFSKGQNKIIHIFFFVFQILWNCFLNLEFDKKSLIVYFFHWFHSWKNSTKPLFSSKYQKSQVTEKELGIRNNSIIYYLLDKQFA